MPRDPLDLVWREAKHHHWRKRELRIGEIDLNYKTEKILNSLAFTYFIVYSCYFI